MKIIIYFLLSFTVINVNSQSLKEQFEKRKEEVSNQKNSNQLTYEKNLPKSEVFLCLLDGGDVGNQLIIMDDKVILSSKYLHKTGISPAFNGSWDDIDSDIILDPSKLMLQYKKFPGRIDWIKNGREFSFDLKSQTLYKTVMVPNRGVQKHVCRQIKSKNSTTEVKVLPKINHQSDLIRYLTQP